MVSLRVARNRKQRHSAKCPSRHQRLETDQATDALPIIDHTRREQQERLPVIRDAPFEDVRRRIRPIIEPLRGAKAPNDRAVEERAFDSADGVVERYDGGIAAAGGEMYGGRVWAEEQGHGEGLLYVERVVVAHGFGWVVVGVAGRNCPREDQGHDQEVAE